MIKAINFSAALIGGALLLTTARAELVFEQSTIELHPAIGDEKAVAHFKYQNKGDKPIAIKNVSTSCGCTAASAKQSAAPGEKGEVTATFNIGDRIGLQQKGISVFTDDPAHPTMTLTLKVDVPQLLELKQALLIWQAKEAPQPKTIVAEAGKDAQVKSVEVTSSNPDFTAKVEPGSSEGEFKITVAPKQTDKVAAATLTIRPVLADGKSKNVYATARIMPPALQSGAAAPNTSTVANSTVANSAKFNPCSLLTSKEIESIQGEPLKMPNASSRADGGLTTSQCYFGVTTSSKSISLIVTQRGDGTDARDPKQFWEQTFHRDLKEKESDGDKEEKEKGEKENGIERKHGEEEEAVPPKKIDGVGEEAYWSGNRFGGALYVLKGDTFIRVSVGGPGDEAARIDKSKKLAQMVLKRL
jgi:Protein of unknown function (DUF1573)